MLAQRVREGQVMVVDELAISESRTKEMIHLLQALGVESKSLVVSGEPSTELALACRNLARVKSLPAATLNTLDLLNYEHVLMSVSAVRKVEELWSQDRRPSRLNEVSSVEAQLG